VTIASRGAWPFMVTTESYHAIVNKPFTEIMTLSRQQAAIEELARLQLRALSFRNDVQYILANQDQFLNPNSLELNASLNVLNEILEQIRKTAVACSKQIDQDCQFPQLNWPMSALPDRVEMHPLALLFG
jgi:hypothetical protein